MSLNEIKLRAPFKHKSEGKKDAGTAVEGDGNIKNQKEKDEICYQNRKNQKEEDDICYENQKENDDEHCDEFAKFSADSISQGNTDSGNKELKIRTEKTKGPLFLKVKANEYDTRAMVDCGASSHFIPKELCEKFELEDQYKKVDPVRVAGALKGMDSTCDTVVRLSISATLDEGINIAAVVDSFKDIVTDDKPSGLPPEQQLTHKIRLIEGTQPTHRQQYCLSHSEKLGMERQVKKLFDPGGGKSRVVAYGSKKLHGAELNYPVWEKEFMATIQALREWRKYLLFDKLAIKLTIIHCLMKN